MPTPRVGRGGGLIGREEELARLRRMGDDGERLISVVGAAGVGKSALARAALETGGRGRTVVEVRWPGPGRSAHAPPKSDGPAAAVLAALGQAKAADAKAGGVRAAGAKAADVRAARAARIDDVVRSLSARLRPRRELVLFLDDMDPVQEACTTVAQQLLNRLPGLRILLTSRRALGLGQERTLRLGPLDHGTAAQEDEPPAVRLFLDRALALRPHHPVPQADYGLVREVCRRLEGHPLAIVQAAHQLTTLELPQLAQRLKSGQCWLTHPRAPLARQTSLRHSLLAVYRQCGPGERIVWSRASTFADAFTEASTAFLCTGGGIRAQDIPRHLAGLAAQGVLTPLGDPGGVRPLRYRMTPAGREFGQERLSRAGETEIAAERCLAHGRQLAHVAEHLWNHGSQRQAVRLLAEEHRNLGGVLSRAVRHPQQAQTALGIVTDLWFWWAAYAHADEGRRHLLKLRAACTPDTPLSAREGWLGALLLTHTAPDTADLLLQEAWPDALLAGDSATAGSVAFVQGLIAWDQGRTETAGELLADAAYTIPGLTPAGLSRPAALAALGLLRAHTAPREALGAARVALAEARVHGDDLACFLARFALAHLDLGRGRTTRAWRRARRILADHGTDGPVLQGLAAVREFLAAIERGERPEAPAPPFPAAGRTVAGRAATATGRLPGEPAGTPLLDQVRPS
ncbi:ATP-binding protein [Streptomyces sp. NPDC050418]|uniref:ATP-binding protein n=1 Tax=Streptomyces sp. NPDC050418 TaxID=3365612 RepID=UPI0037A666C8